MSDTSEVQSAAGPRASIRSAVDRVVGVPLTEEDRDLLQGSSFAHLATLSRDGEPHSTVVWIDVDGDLILFNTAEGRLKAEHVRNDPRVALSLTAPDNPYRELAIKGEVVEVTREGADAHIDKLAQRYLGKERYPFRQPGEQRLIVKIRPLRIHRNGR